VCPGKTSAAESARRIARSVAVEMPESTRMSSWTTRGPSHRATPVSAHRPRHRSARSARTINRSSVIAGLQAPDSAKKSVGAVSGHDGLAGHLLRRADQALAAGQPQLALQLLKRCSRLGCWRNGAAIAPRPRSGSIARRRTATTRWR
jgi:hypothetical protein